MTSRPSSKPRPETRGQASPLRALLASIVDYAGLFPPAGLDMRAAVQAYDRYRRGEHAWMLGAFVVPAARLTELGACATSFQSGGAWPLSVLVPSLVDAPRSYGDQLEVHSIEVAPLEPETIVAAGSRTPQGIRVFYEVTLDDRMETRLDAVARAGAAAKVRTGGVTVAAFPAASRLADFIGGCVERGLAFKATAGLHHPTRGCYALTYESGSPSADMYGFLDVALAAALLRSRRIDVAETAELLSRLGDVAALAGDGVHWGGHAVSTAEISTLRRELFLSFGSCSFEEPVADLKRIGLL